MNQILNNNILQWEPVKRTMTYHDFVTIFPRSERIKHCNSTEIDTNTGHEYAKGILKHNFGQILGDESQIKHAVKNLKQFILDRYNIELIGAQTKVVQLCHLCKNNCRINKKDSNKHTCTAPTHVYFGTVLENHHDIDPLVRSALSSIAGSASTKSPKNSCRVREKCPYCEFESIKWNLKGRHIPFCHFNSNSKNYLTPITLPYTKKSYQQQGLYHKLIELELMIAENYNNQHK